MKRRLLPILLVLSALVPSTDAHDGPPFPIIEGKRVGPCVIALWTHPDIGTGTFWIMVDAPPGGAVPKDLAVKLSVQPVDGRIPERTFSVTRDDSGGQLQYKALVPFDRQEFVNARVILHSASGEGEAAAKVEITPVGPSSKWQMLLFVWPFLGVAFLWFRVAIRRRRAAP